MPDVETLYGVMMEYKPLTKKAEVYGPSSSIDQFHKKIKDAVTEAYNYRDASIDAVAVIWYEPSTQKTGTLYDKKQLTKILNDMEAEKKDADWENMSPNDRRSAKAAMRAEYERDADA